MATKDVGNINIDGIDTCPMCKSPYIHYLICDTCGYYEGTPT